MAKFLLFKEIDNFWIFKVKLDFEKVYKIWVKIGYFQKLKFYLKFDGSDYEIYTLFLDQNLG